MQEQANLFNDVAVRSYTHFITDCCSYVQAEAGLYASTHCRKPPRPFPIMMEQCGRHLRNVWMSRSSSAAPHTINTAISCFSELGFWLSDDFLRRWEEFQMEMNANKKLAQFCLGFGKRARIAILPLPELIYT